jgi:hypothetical protein
LKNCLKGTIVENLVLDIIGPKKKKNRC